MKITRHDFSIARGERITLPEAPIVGPPTNAEWRMSLVVRAAEAVGGQRRLARLLKIHNMKTFRWARGETPLPDDMLEPLAAIIDHKETPHDSPLSQDH